MRLIALLLGLTVPQLLLFGPSLSGSTYLLPLDVLAGEGHYIVPTLSDELVLHSNCYADIVTHNETDRQFAAREVRAGRWPLWNPYIYAGTPFAVWPKLAPHSLLYCLLPTPVTLAWLQLGKTLIGGVGAYLFFRRALGVGYWPAVIGAWCLPLTGYFILWQGCVMSYTAAALPWLLLGVEWVVRRPGDWGGPALAVITWLLIIDSSADTAALALVASGLYAVWRLAETHWRNWRPGWRAVAALSAGWGLGVVLSLPYLLPLAQYVASSAQVAERSAGYEPRPPLPFVVAASQVILPLSHGPYQGRGYVQLFTGNFLESAASTYVGLVATLWLAPLAFLSRPQRFLSALWVVWIILGLGWQLNLPGVIHAMRLPLLNIFPYSRFVFAASFAMVALAVTGLEALAQNARWRSWCWVFVILSGLVGLWCLAGLTAWPAALGADTEAKLQAGWTNRVLPDLPTLWNAREEYVRYRLYGAFLCVLAILGWLAVLLGRRATRRTFVIVAAVWLGELLCFAMGRNPQCDPALYYPPRPIFEALRQAAPGRILGVMCFPANYCVARGLRDVRGYDGVDPARLVRVMDLARQGPPHRPIQVQWFIPDVARTESGAVRVAPVLSMLQVRYFLFYGDPTPGWPVMLQGDGFWVYENRDAVPRVYVPREVSALDSDAKVFAAIARPDFVPQRTAYVEASSAPAGSGKAEIVAELPSEITIDVEMDEAGLVVLAERWDPDWHVQVDGQAAPLLRVNYLLRGVAAPAGRSRVVFRYEPASWSWGLAAMACGSVLLATWIVVKRLVRAAPSVTTVRG